jgi:alkylation response protein AidB-like acyl-CoA dehydrogenase
VGRSKAALKHLKEIARRETCHGRPLLEDLRFRDRIAQVEMELMALAITNMRVLSSEKEKKAPGPEASILKIKGSEIQQTIAELQMSALGHYALPWQPEALDAHWDGESIGPDYAAPLTGHYFNYRKTTIYGGSNEIQKNIIAQMILGL